MVTIVMLYRAMGTGHSRRMQVQNYRFRFLSEHVPNAQALSTLEKATVAEVLLGGARVFVNMPLLSEVVCEVSAR